MSNRASAWAWVQDVKSGPKFVLVALADRADEEGECFPSVNWLCDKTGFSKSAVKENIARLFKLELLEITSRRRVDGSHTSNLYRLTIPAEFALKNRGSDSGLGGVKSGPGGVESNRGTPESGHHKTLNHTPSYPQSKKDEAEAFVKWFSEQYQLHFKQPLAVKKRDTGTIMEILSQFTIERAKVVALRLLTTRDAWLVKTGRDIAMLSSQWNKLSIEEVRVEEVPSVPVWHHPDAK